MAGRDRSNKPSSAGMLVPRSLEISEVTEPLLTDDGPIQVIGNDLTSKVFHLSPEAMSISSLDDGRLIAVNASFERVFGYARKEALGNTSLELHLWEDPEDRWRFVKDLGAKGEVHEIEHTFRTKSGESRLGVTSATTVEIGENRFVIAVTRDITEQSRKTSAHRENEEQLRLALDAARMGTWTWDIASGRVAWSDRVYALFGTDPESFAGTYDAFRDRVHPDDLDRLEGKLRKTLETGVGFEVEHRARRDDGVEIWLHGMGRVFYDEAGKPLRMIGTVSDITDRKRTEERLRVMEFSIDHAADAVFLTRKDASFAYVNQRACDWLGYARAELMEKSVFDLDRTFTTFTAEQFSTFWEERARDGFSRSETVFQKKDGSTMPAELNLSYFHFNGQEYISAFVRDLTERNRAQSALRESETQLQQAQKMEAIGLLAGGVAHDFNNILTVITGYSNLILTAGTVDAKTRDRIEEISKASERAAALTRQLLAFGRRQVLKPRPTDLNEVVSEMSTLLTRIISEDIELEISNAASSGKVLADPSQIEQIVMNLAVNAKDAMANGGTLSISVEPIELDEESVLPYAGLKKGDYIRLTVIDDGDGIPEELVPRLFEPFFTTKERGRGTGLGLSTVYGIVKQSGGFIYASNTDERGARFDVFLPRLVTSTPLSKVVPLRHSRNKGSILLVDDDEPIRLFAREILSSEGYDLLDAASGEDALAILEARGDLIDLLITDVVMPRMNGVELVEETLSRFPGINILYVTGYPGDTIAPLGLDRSSLDVLQKPFTAQALAARVAEKISPSRTGT